MSLLSLGDFPEWGFTVYVLGYPDEAALGAMPQNVDDRFVYSMKVSGCLKLTWNHGSECEAGEQSYHTGNGDITGCFRVAKGGFGHIGISVPDVYVACEQLMKLGCEMIKSPNTGAMKGIAFVRDP